MEGRFLSWCLMLVTWLVVLASCFLLLAMLGLSGWQRFAALVPVLLLLRYTVQRFLAKGRR